MSSPKLTGFAVASRAAAIDEVRVFYYGWVDCWQGKDLQGYLECYSANCQIKRTGQRWYGKPELERRIRGVFERNSWILIETGKLDIAADDDSAHVVAEQHYTSPTYADEGKKYLDLREVNGRWLILRENFVRCQLGTIGQTSIGSSLAATSSSTSSLLPSRRAKHAKLTLPALSGSSRPPSNAASPRVTSGPTVAENGSYYGQISEATGRPKTVYVRGYYRRNGTYVRSHYRSRPRR